MNTEVERELRNKLLEKVQPVVDSEEPVNTTPVNVLDMSVAFQGHSDAGTLSQERTNRIFVPMPKKRHDRQKPKGKKNIKRAY